MPNLKWLRDYSGQTVEQLISLEGEYRIDSLIVAFWQAVDQKSAREGEGNLSEEETFIIAIEVLESEVNNGGYNLFFTGPSKEYTPVIVSALFRIGCPRTAQITQRAIDALHLPALTIEAIDAAMVTENGERERVLNECDDLYYHASEDIAGNLFAFIRANKSAIRL